MYNIPLQPYGQYQFDRAQQINELLVSIPQCRAASSDRSLLELPVRLANGATIILRISLPAGFPQERPVLSVASPVRHPWVDSIGRVSLPTLDRWAGSGVRLAAVVSEAMQGLASAAAPPGGAPQPPPGPGRPGPPPPPPQQQQQQVPPPHGRPASPQKPRLPPPRTSFPELEEMSTSDLAAALTSEEAYAALVQRVLEGGDGAGPGPEGHEASQVVRQLREQVEEAARRNLSLEEEMAQVRNQIAIVRSSEYAPARAAYDDKAQRQQGVLDLLAPRVLVQRLQAAAAAAEEEGEAVYRAYHEGGLGVEAFVAQYTAARAVFHQRDLKAQAALQTIPMDV